MSCGPIPAQAISHGNAQPATTPESEMKLILALATLLALSACNVPLVPLI